MFNNNNNNQFRETPFGDVVARGDLFFFYLINTKLSRISLTSLKYNVFKVVNDSD